VSYKWLPKALDWADMWCVDQEMVEAAADHPTQITDDPTAVAAGYPIKRHRRGDLEVCVGYKNPEEPTIIYVRMHLPLDGSSGSPTGGGAVKKAAAKAPNGLRQFKDWVHDAGYRTKLQNGHTHVLRPDGSLLMTTSSTPGDKMTVTAAWQKFLRQSAADLVAKNDEPHDQ
jgi:hypothetical protein